MGGSGAQAVAARRWLGLSPHRPSRASAWRVSGGPARWLLVALCLAAGCGGSSLVSIDGAGRLRHTTWGYEVGPPPAGSPAWHRVEVQGATLAYQREGDELMSLRVSCDRPQATPRILARHLRIGVGRYVMRSEGPVEHANLGGWQQTFDVGGEGHDTVRVQSVTLVDARCTVDFILSASGSFEERAAAFETWWRSYGPIQRGFE